MGMSECVEHGWRRIKAGKDGWWRTDRRKMGIGWMDGQRKMEDDCCPQEAREVSGNLRRELGDSESRRAALEQRLEQLSTEAEGCRQAQDEAVREAARLRADTELLRRYCCPSVHPSVCHMHPSPCICPSPRVSVCLQRAGTHGAGAGGRAGEGRSSATQRG